MRRFLLGYIAASVPAGLGTLGMTANINSFVIFSMLIYGIELFAFILFMLETLGKD